MREAFFYKLVKVVREDINNIFFLFVLKAY